MGARVEPYQTVRIRRAPQSLICRFPGDASVGVAANVAGPDRHRHTANVVDVYAAEVRPAGEASRRIGLAPRRHRRPRRSLGPATAVIVTGLAVLAWWGLAALVSGPPPTEPGSPIIGLPPSGAPTGSAPVNPPVGSSPLGTAGIGPGNRPLPRAPGPAAPNGNDRSPAAQQKATRLAVPRPVPRPPAPQRPAPAPERAPSPVQPARSPAQPAPSPAAPPLAPPDVPPPPGRGKGAHPQPAPERNGPKVDRRYASCDEVVAAGLGPYKERRDVEYGWYPDLDGDGWTCERPRWGPGRR